jgi:hypothetical protein
VFSEGANLAALPRATGEFTLTRKGSTLFPLTVKYSVGGSATQGSDYTALGGEVVIPAGSASATVAVQPIDDEVYEGDESVVVKIDAPPSAPYLGGESMSATVTIVDDENQVTVRPSTRWINETGTESSATFIITRAGPTTEPLAVNYVVDTNISLAARQGEDYNLMPESVTIEAGAATARLTVRAINDTQPEPDEVVRVMLRDGPGYDLGSQPDARLFIADNDSVVQIVGEPGITGILENAGGTSTFTVSRTGSTNSGAPFEVRFRTEGTATEGVDYTITPQVVRFANGAAIVTIEVKPLQDGTVEGDESVIITLLEDTARYTLNDSSKSAQVIISERGQRPETRP